MPATKSGSTIFIDGSPNTLSSITADIGDVSWIEENPAGTFTIKDKDLSIRDGGIATIGDSGDYSVSEKLIFHTTSSNNCNLYIGKGGELQLFGDVEIDATDAPGSKYNYWYFYGKFYVRGNETYKPTIEHIYRIFRYYNSYPPTYDRNHDVNDVDYLEFKNPYNTSSRWFTLSETWHIPDKDVDKWKHIDFSTLATRTQHNIELNQNSAFYAGGDLSKLLFENCTFKKGNIGALGTFYIPLHLKDCLFDNNPYGAIDIGRSILPGNQIYSPDYLPSADFTNQQFMFCEGGTFTNNGNDDVIVEYGASFLAKDCDFSGSQNGIKTSYGGRAYIWTGNTFSGVRLVYKDLGASIRGLVYYVHALDLTVQSKETGNPLADAMVYIKQKDGKEKWLFKTDANGKPINMSALDGKIILIHKEQTDFGGSAFDLWSDPGNSTYHEIWIWKEGYEPHKLTYEMNADRTVTVELEDALIEAEVQAPVPFGLGLIGTLSVDYPAVGNVEKGVVYEGGAKTGTFKVPSENDVRKPEQYGADDVEFTGKAIIPGKADVRKDIDVDVSDKGILDLPSVGDVEKDVKFDNETKTGTFKIPETNQVEKGVKYGADGAEFTGNLTVLPLLTVPLTGTLTNKINLTGTLRDKTNLTGTLRKT